MVKIQLYLILFTVFNIFLFSNAKYIGTPQKADELKVAFKKELELQCEYTGVDGNGQFLGWYKDDKPIVQNKTGHYLIKGNKKRTKLIITFEKEDAEVNKWSVKTNKPDQEEPIECQFAKIPVIPSPILIETDRPGEKVDHEQTTIRRAKNDSVTFKCIIEPERTDPNRTKHTKWKFSRNSDDEQSLKLPKGAVRINENEISILRINKTHRGYYRCSYNNITLSVLLRIDDRLAALWPFIGIVSAVLVLVTIILIYEKRQRLARKAAAAVVDDELNFNANDPLVRSSNKSSDIENKKRTVNA